MHTSEGKFLVTRLVPCPKCLSNAVDTDQLVSMNDQPSDPYDSAHKNVFEVTASISFFFKLIRGKMFLNVFIAVCTLYSLNIQATNMNC